MDVLLERIRSRNPSSFVHGPVSRKAVFGATFAKSKKPASLFQGYHQKTKHIGSDFSLIRHRGGVATQDMEKRCSGPEANATRDDVDVAFRSLNNGTSHEDLGTVVSSKFCLSFLVLMRLLSRWPDMHNRLAVLRQIGFSELFQTFLQSTPNMFP